MDIYLVNTNLTAGGAVKEIFDIYESMITYIVGFFNAGNISKDIHEIMKVFLADNDGYHRSKEFLSRVMDIFLVNIESRKYVLEDKKINGLNILESYFYLRDNESFMPLADKVCENFMLDSGAFTFMQGNHNGKINWDEYTEEYGEFIIKYKIQNYIELDIDNIVGINEVERLRKKLETITGKKPIPVWHKSRGKDYFLKMCDEYPYIAIGGIVTKEIPRQIYEKAFPWFIKEAHKRGAKIHGLGYTGVEKLKEYHFDSVDSTAWLHGNRGGYLYKYNPLKKTMDKIEGKGRLKSREGAINNFCEWLKFSRYAKLYL